MKRKDLLRANTRMPTSWAPTPKPPLPKHWVNPPKCEGCQNA